MIGYKIAKNDITRVIVTLEIPKDAQTNMGRSSVAFPATAKYRASKAKVLAITGAQGAAYATATSFNYDKKSITYTVGEMIEESSYNPDPEKVCAEGIHFFLTRRVAELYGLEKVNNGLYQSWHDNGQMCTEVTYVDRKFHGRYQTWWKNGRTWMEATYIHGKRQLYQSWYENGQKEMEVTYRDGEIHGLYKAWHITGQKWVEATYVDGERQESLPDWT